MPPAFEAAAFDLDGVVFFTARVHSAAWKDVFDDFLRARARTHGEPFRPFTEEDYRLYVDGRTREDGIRTFLAARGIQLPEGSPEDPPGAASIAGLARRKNDVFRARLRRGGVEVDTDAVAFIRSLREHGIRTGAASSSRNAGMILDATGLAGLFDASVDGITIKRFGLAGKPAPDLFLACLRQLGIRNPACALVVEDATVGVGAGRAAGFGLVIGVDRNRRGRAREMREHGADAVIASFRDISFEMVDSWFRRHQRERCA